MSPLTYPPCSIADWTPQSYGLLPALPIRGGCLAERRGRMPGRMPGRARVGLEPETGRIRSPHPPWMGRV